MRLLGLIPILLAVLLVAEYRAVSAGTGIAQAAAVGVDDDMRAFLHGWFGSPHRESRILEMAACTVYLRAPR